MQDDTATHTKCSHINHIIPVFSHVLSMVHRCIPLVCHHHKPLVKPVRHCILLRTDFVRLANGVDTRQSWCFWSDLCSPLKSNMAPEKWWLEDDPASYWVSVTFQGRTVKLREGSSAHVPFWLLYHW